MKTEITPAADRETHAHTHAQTQKKSYEYKRGAGGRRVSLIHERTEKEREKR